MRTALSALLLAIGMAGCATGRISSEERLALYRAHAGDPVGEFRYPGRLSGWTALGNDALAVWTKPNEAYLLELGGGCVDLDFANTILITNMMGRVSARSDRVQVIDSPRGFNIACRIQSIRPLQVKALRVSEKELREARGAEREVP
ncbi:MAG TPA: hypothetical protein DDZ67_01490 [Xanthomonadaceae bacterium]|nr:hypothetical protein [Xanthomonadaceae bacterium]